MEFPGRKPVRSATPGVSHITFRVCRLSSIGLPPSTDKHTGPDRHGDVTAKPPEGYETFRRLSDRLTSADLGGQLSDDVAQVRGDLGILPRMLPVEGLEGDRQSEVLDDARTRDPERLTGLVMRPHT